MDSPASRSALAVAAVLLSISLWVNPCSADKVSKLDLPIMMKFKEKYIKKIPQLKSWTAANDCKKWEPFASCDGDRIGGVYIQGLYLGGKFPYYMTGLKMLRHWYGDGNNFTGEFPDGFAKCPNLEVLRLSYNLLSGKLPASLGGLKKLYKFYVKGNYFLTGNIPKTWGQLTLQEAYFDSNSFSGPFPTVICQWKILQRLRMGNNSFTGKLPGCITKLTDLVNLYIDNVPKLRGKIPAGIGGLKDLEIVNLGGNQIGGPIPESIGNLQKLEVLFLCGNKITGPLPKSMGKMKKMREWTMEFNHINGEIPTEIGDMSNLERILLDNNRLTGEIPSSIAKLSKLTMLLLQGNSLSGTIPPAIPQKLKKLVQINVASNWLTGTVPQKWASRSLVQVNYRSNFLVGSPDVFLDNGKLYCPKEQVAEWIISSAMYNCFTQPSACGRDELQRPKKTCKAFCGASTPLGTCRGKGRCIWVKPQKLKAKCKCNKRTRISRSKQFCR